MTQTPTRPAASKSAGAARTAGGRKFNFSAGPGCMPEEVLSQIREEVWDCRNTGVGILEHSHRGPTFDRILEEAERDFREIGAVQKNYRVLFMTGGSTAQNFMIPMNFLPADGMGTADYYDTGYWAHQSIEHARPFGKIHVCASSRESNYDRIPEESEVRHSERPAYVHYTSNNTIFGTQFHRVPNVPAPGVELVCDVCSDIYSRPVDFSRFGLAYASAQKNLGPAGVTIVVVRDDLVERGRRDIATMLQYRTFAAGESRPNTPPVFPIYCVGLMLKWIKGRGGLKHFEVYNAEKAEIVYRVLDGSKFYRGHAQKGSRSLMNVTFRCPTPEMDDRFCAEAEREGLDFLKGHRAAGGMRASLYNAMPREGGEALAEFMREFERRNG
ncbi:MAG: 3-phosphoserine/phosphohydroxythreonine transaminase [Phycisphaeraceae bacterium]|nr:3-phosphoserine/phosphohydroxythreonine transaminase [Phycisphaeraceae bacterium]